MTLAAESLCVVGDAAPRRMILEDVTLAVEGGQLTALVGPNGAGKSTLLSALAGVLTPSSGRVTLDGRDVRGLGLRERARTISWMSQGLTVPFAYRALEVARLGCTPRRGAYALPTADDDHAALAALAEVGVEALVESCVTSLSGGELQRVHVAMQLVHDAKYALYDEPSSAQDFDGVARIIAAIRARIDRGGAAVVALHDLGLASRVADRLVLLDRGRVTAQGDVDAVMGSDAMRRAYGEALVLRRGDGAWTAEVALPSSGLARQRVV